MTQTRSPDTNLVTAMPAAVPAVAGATAAAMAIYQVARPGSEAATFDSVLDWLREGLFLTYLLGSILTMVFATRTGLATRAPALLVSAGYGLIAIGVLVGMALQKDPDWFFVLAGPGLLASTTGFVWFAVSGFRRRVLPGWAALLAGVGGATAIAMSELGTSILIGAFWLWVAAESGKTAHDLRKRWVGTRPRVGRAGGI
jgi:hypothetical protein